MTFRKTVTFNLKKNEYFEYETNKQSNNNIYVDLFQSKQINLQYINLDLLHELIHNRIELLLKLPTLDTVIIQFMQKNNNEWLSHILVRLCIINNPKTINKFVEKESELFRYRYLFIQRHTNINITHIYNCIIGNDNITQDHNINIISGKNNIHNVLYGTDKLQTLDFCYVKQDCLDDLCNHGSICIYQIKFSHALSVINNKDVVVRKGYAYVPCNLMYHVLEETFKKKLTLRMQLLMDKYTKLKSKTDLSDSEISFLEIKNRIQNLSKKIIGLFTRYVAKRNINVTKINIIDIFSSLPPCMKICMLKAQRCQKLKHWSLLQVVLFMKSINIPYQQVLTMLPRQDTYQIHYLYFKVDHYQSMKCFTINDLCDNCVWSNTNPISLKQQLIKMYGVFDYTSIALMAKNKVYSVQCCRDLFKLIFRNNLKKHFLTIYDIETEFKYKIRNSVNWFRASEDLKNYKTNENLNHNNTQEIKKKKKKVIIDYE